MKKILLFFLTLCIICFSYLFVHAGNCESIVYLNPNKIPKDVLKINITEIQYVLYHNSYIRKSKIRSDPDYTLPRLIDNVNMYQILKALKINHSYVFKITRHQMVEVVRYTIYWSSP